MFKTVAVATFAVVGLVPTVSSHVGIHATQAPPSTIVNNVVIARDVPPEPVIPPDVMHAWALVNICETGGDWHTKGPIYSGGLGILEVNWMKYGGWMYGAEYAATPAEQVFIAIKIQATHGYAGYVPDQYGCGNGW